MGAGAWEAGLAREGAGAQVVTVPRLRRQRDHRRHGGDPAHPRGGRVVVT
ncbi:MAG: hypothetical protein R2851_28470 [Caldilineaceae bacterium]